MKIIVDTREKVGKFKFNSFEVETISRCLKTGDYSLVGYEDKITIDRKFSTGELQMCFGIGWKRFKKELERMVSFDEAYIMCTFPYSFVETFPISSGVPENKWSKLRITANFIKKRIEYIEKTYPNIKFIFNDTYYEAEEKTYNILKDFYVKVNTEQ